MILTVTRRLVDSTSYVVLSSSTSGQLTIPLVDPETGKTAHYALVKVDTPPSVSSLGLSPRLHMRSVSDSGHPHTSGPKSETACRLDRLEKECMLDVSREALRMLEDDTAWPRLASSSRSSPSRVLAPTASSFSSAYVVHKQQTAYAETPSMFNESRSEDSVSYVGTPVSPSHSQRQNTVTAFGSTSARNSAMLVGLGIIGMTKEDGSPFDGLGSLPRIVYASRTTHFPMTSPPAYAPASEPSWPFLHGLSPAAFANDTSEDPITRFWKTATAADFRRYLDDSVFSHQLTAPLGACGSWKVAKKARTACAPSLAPVSRGHKKHFSMPRAEEDVFMCRTPALSSLSDRIMTHLEGTKLEEESWEKASDLLGAAHVPPGSRPLSCII
ncbi:hypothetical protein DAEQUDRAFT_753986 [Daedalea quercina L-15889]|uniref:Uncharacterized protein n=1 Tax=Daedalea quercina L-15889 TaxID=1314783 RepID=A0A165U9Y8_9APHY|nr:hypothetical protein DAEQUDRAFT_753986 [Daedalea quercina L-15889]